MESLGGWVFSFIGLLAMLTVSPRVAPAAPTIGITSVPPYAVDGFISGTVTGVDFTAYAVAPYIQIEGLGWYTKPTFLQPTVPIDSNGRFTADVATGGIDNRATIYCVQLIPAGTTPPQANGAGRVPENPASVAINCGERYGRTLQFAGLPWAVKEAPVAVGPGANHFSDRTEDVFVDDMGRLHLAVNFHDGSWWATEVILLASPRGYGIYSFQTFSALATLDVNLTFGAFTWDSYGDDTSVPGAPNREIDFEDSRWGNASDPTNAQEVVQPFEVAGNLHRYTIPSSLSDLAVCSDQRERAIEMTPTAGPSSLSDLEDNSDPTGSGPAEPTPTAGPSLAGDAALTRFFDWGPARIEFVALRGYHPPFNYSPTDVIDRFIYTHDPGSGHFVPTAGRERFRFNLWPNNVERGGSPRPSNGLPAEVVIVNFGPPCPCRGDANKNRFSNSTDLATVQATFGRPADPVTGLGDADCNGFVNSTDFAAVQANFGQPCP